MNAGERFALLRENQHARSLNKIKKIETSCDRRRECKEKSPCLVRVSFVLLFFFLLTSSSNRVDFCLIFYK